MSEYHPIWIWKKSYGGWKALFLSSYFLSSFVLTALCAPLWLMQQDGSFLWPQYPIAIMPSLLSFSIGGFAIFLALSNGRMLDAAREDGVDDSLYMSVCSVFFNAIIFQISSILLALILLALSKIGPHLLLKIYSMIGYFVFLYSIISVLAIAVSLLQLAQLINRADRNQTNR